MNKCSKISLASLELVAKNKDNDTKKTIKEIVNVMNMHKLEPEEALKSYFFLKNPNVPTIHKKNFINGRDKAKYAKILATKDFSSLVKISTDGEYNSLEELKEAVISRLNYVGDREDSHSAARGLNDLFGRSSEEEVEEEILATIQKEERIQSYLTSSSSDMMIKKSKRIEKTSKDISGSSDVWGSFLNVYFEGMTDIGTEFNEFATNKVMNSLIDFTEEGVGFVDNISKVIEDLKTEVFDSKEALKESSSGNFDITKANLQGNENLKNRYFYDILHNELDFILENSIKLVVKNDRETYNKYTEVYGFNGVEDVGGIVYLNTEFLEKLGVIFMNEEGDYETSRGDYIINTIDSDLYDFKSRSDLKPDSFYYVVHDDIYIYITKDGSMRDVSVRSSYNINTRNNRRTMAFGKEADVLDQGTAFINNIFSAVRIIRLNPKKMVYEYGNRMSISEFYKLSPFLIKTRPTLQSLNERLSELMDGENVEIANIARSTYYHFFSPTSKLVGADSVFSLSTKKGKDGFNYQNDNIVTALGSALISKKHEKYFEFNGNSINITKDLLQDIPEYFIDDNLATYLTNRGYTKPIIANHLFVKGGDVIIYKNNKYTNDSIRLDDIKTIEDAMEASKILNLSSFTDPLYQYIADKEYLDRDIESAFVTIVQKLITISANNMKTRVAGKKQSSRLGAILDDSYIAHGDYKYVKPTVVFTKIEIDYLIPIFTPETLGNVSVAGNKRPSLNLPNRNAFLQSQIIDLKKLSAYTFNPILSKNSPVWDVDTSLLDYYIKAPMTSGGVTLGVAEWGQGKRLEFEIINGFINGPVKSRNIGELGNTFFIQPLGYSDKANPHVFRMVLGEDVNIFKPGTEFEQQMEDAYINFEIARYEDMQKVLIEDMAYFIGGNYNEIYNTLKKEGANKTRLINLSKLRNMLLGKTYPTQGDMTRPINLLLDKIKIPNKIIKYAETTLEHKSDFVDIGGNHVILKPHMGVRAAAFRDHGEDILTKHIEDYEELMTKHKVSKKNVIDSFRYAKRAMKLRGVKKQYVSSFNDIVKRVFIANHIYGTSVKVITMADESSYPIKKYNASNISAYYKDIDTGKTSGLEDIDGMQKAQYKRSQSNLSGGVRYMQNETIEGIKHKSNRDNILNFLEIYEDEDGKLEHRYDKLQGKSLYELYALGVIDSFDNKSLVKIDKTGNFLVRIKEGNDIIEFKSTQYDASDEYDIGIKKLFTDAIKVSSTGKQNVKILPNTKNIHNNRKDYLELHQIEDKFNEKGLAAILPDTIHSILVEDPVSYVNLLNFFGYDQDNSDGVQFIHPVLYHMFDNSRGGEFGAFHSTNYEALKTITTVINHRNAKQQLQKKAVQMPFSIEQLTKVGNIKLWNAFKTMNTAVEFKKKRMRVIVDKEGNKDILIFNNMQQLVEHFIALNSDNLTDQIWEDIIHTLEENPANMYSFVGNITFETTQKTGNYSENTFDNIFEKNFTTTKPNLYQTNYEYNFEILSKAHSYDISEDSALSLLTQLVNSISLGGVTDTESFNLQSAMASLAEVHKAILGKDFEKIARAKLEESGNSKYNSIIERFSTGNLDVEGFTAEQKELYADIVREGLASMANLAYNETTSPKLIKDLIDNSKYSLDTPAIQRIVLGTLRSNLFKATVKIKQNGFIAVVTTPHLTASVYSYVTEKGKNRRLTRQAFIKANLNRFDETSGAKEITFLITDESSIAIADENLTPFDSIKVKELGKAPVIVAKHTIVANEGYPPGTIFTMVLPPDSVESTKLDNVTDILKESTDENALAIGDNSLVNIVEDGKDNTYYAWYALEVYGLDGLTKLIKAGKVTRNTVEKYSLRWYKYINKVGAEIEDTEAFKNYYRIYLNKDSNNSDKESAKAVLFLELVREDNDGDKIWSVIPAEIITPNFLAGAFNLDPDVSLSDILGIEGDTFVNVKNYFRNRLKFNLFKPVKETSRREFLLAKYGRKYAFSGATYIKEIIGVLTNNTTISSLSTSEVTRINNIIIDAKEEHLQNKANSFLEALLINASRTPGQSMQSGYNARVIEFINAQGNAVMAPTEHLVTTGGDFDIDTLNILTSNITKDGIILSYEEFMDEGHFNRERFFKKFEDTIKEANESLDNYFTDFKNILDEKIAILESAEIEKEEKEHQLKTLHQLQFTESQVKRMRKNLNTNIINSFDSHVLNIMKDSITGAYSNIDAAIAASTPMVFTIMKAIEATAIDLSETKKIEFMQYHGESPIYNMLAEEEALQGKGGISVYAISIKMNGSIQGARVMWDKKYKDSIGDLYDNENIDNIFDAVSDNDAPYMFQGHLETNSVRRPSLRSLQNSSGVIYFTDTPINDTSAKHTFNIASATTLVLTAGDTYNSADSLGKIRDDALASGYSSVVIKGFEKNGSFYNIVIPTEVNSDSIKKPEKGTFKIDPFRFDLSISYSLRGKKVTRTRHTFADLNENILKQYVKNKDFNRAAFSIPSEELTGPETDKLTSGLIEVLLNNIKIDRNSSDTPIADIIKEVFNIDIDIKATKMDEAIIEFYDKIHADKQQLVDAYLYLIGKDTIYDVQAQFMSSAVDNAKELILSKIKANDFTNSIVSTMMLLGFDANIIVEFLHDPMMDVILDKLLDKKVNFEDVFLSTKLLKELKGVSEKNTFVKSLIKILEVNTEVFNFLSVKNLNENFKIDQYALDKINGKIATKKLYKAILDKDITKIPRPRKKDKGKKIFHPELMIFLHEPTNALFVNIYEVENSLLPALSRIVTVLRKISGDDKSDIIYKNINNYISRALVDMYIKNKKYTGTILDDNGNEVEKSLTDPYVREEFVLGFKDYFLKTVHELKNVYGVDTNVFDYFGSALQYQSEFSQLNVPLLNHSRPDNIKIGSIQQGIKDLKVTEEDAETTRKKIKFHDNLMKYALIVNAGEIKKNSLVELFPEILFDFSEYLKTLKDTDFFSIVIKNKYIKDLIKGTVHTKRELLEEVYKQQLRGANKSDNFESYGNTINDDTFGDDAQGENMQVYSADSTELEDQLDLDETTSRKTNTRTVGGKKVEKVPSNLRNKIFKSNDTSLYKEIFLGVSPGFPAFRLFPAGIKEAIFNESVSREFEAFNLSTKLLADLSRSGYRIGMASIYKGDSTVLGYSGVKRINKKFFDMYLVQIGSLLYYVPGISIMEADPEIFLSKNRIEKVSAKNMYDAEKIIDKVTRFIPALEDYTIERAGIDGFVMSSTTKKLIGGMVLDKMNPVEKSDISVLQRDDIHVLQSSREGSYSNIMNRMFQNVLQNNFTYDAEDVDSVFVPHIVGKTFNGNFDTNTSFTMNSIYMKILEGVNKMDAKESLVFIGSVTPNYGKTGGDSKLTEIGGDNLIRNMIKKYFDVDIIAEGNYTIGNFKVHVSTESSEDGTINTRVFKFYKATTQLSYQIEHEGKLFTVDVNRYWDKISKKTISSVKNKNINSSYYYKMLFNGIVNNVPLHAGAFPESLTKIDVFNNAVYLGVIGDVKTSKTLVVGLQAEGGSINYYKLKNSRIKTPVVDGSDIKVSKDIFNNILSIIEEDNEIGDVARRRLRNKNIIC